MDQEVADAIAGQGGYSPEHHKSNWFEEWKTKLLNILSDTKNALLLIGTALLLKLANEYDSLENTIKKWYGNAKKEVKEIWDKIELANTVLSLSELAVIALIDVKTAQMLKNLGLNFLVPDYSDLNKNGKDGNLDLVSVIQKMYKVYSRNVNDFMAGGAVSIDNNIYFGSLQKSSGFDEALQPDTSAFKWGKAITDAALLVAGAAGFVIGGLGEAGGVAFDATGVGAVVGIPLSVGSAIAMEAGGALAINSSKSLVNDGLNLMSGEGKASNEASSETKGGAGTSRDGLGAVDDIAAQGKKVLDNFDIDSAYVKPKHLATSGGNGAKFLGETKEAAEVILQDAMKNGTVKSVADNGLTKMGKQSYQIIIDAGKEVGTKGETLIKIVISEDGGMLSAYPVK